MVFWLWKYKGGGDSYSNSFQVAGDPESCIAYKSNGKDFGKQTSKFQILREFLGGGEILNLDVNDIDLNTLDLPENYDTDQLAEILAQYQGKRRRHFSTSFFAELWIANPVR